MNKPPHVKTWSAACFSWPVNTRYGVFFLIFPERSTDNPLWIGHIWPGHWFLETPLRLYCGLVELNWNQRWRRRWSRWAEAAFRCESAHVYCHGLVNLKMHNISPWISSHNKVINKVIRPQGGQGGCANISKNLCGRVCSVCVRAVSVYTIYNIFTHLHLMLELKVSLLK